MNEIEKLLAQHFGDIAALIHEQVRWWGTQVESIAPARDIIQAGSSFTDDETRELQRFYSGETQWPREVLLIRSEPVPRPCLVVNRLPDLVAAALQANTTAGLEPLDSHELAMLPLVVTRQNKDAQMLYNYLLSSLAERLAPCPVITS